MSEDEHPMDRYLGDIHETALALQLYGWHESSIKLAEAYENIQQYIIDIEAMLENRVEK